MTENTTQPDFTPAVPIGTDSEGYDPLTDTYHVRFDESTSLVVTIVETVALATNRDPLSLPPLLETIDPEALGDVVTSGRETPITVCFPYEGCDVTVSSHGTIVVEPPEQ